MTRQTLFAFTRRSSSIQSIDLVLDDLTLLGTASLSSEDWLSIVASGGRGSKKKPHTQQPIATEKSAGWISGKLGLPVNDDDDHGKSVGNERRCCQCRLRVPWNKSQVVFEKRLTSAAQLRHVYGSKYLGCALGSYTIEAIKPP